MTGFLLRTAVVGVGLWLAARILPGLSFDGPLTLVAAALLLGVVNTVLRPLAILLTLPLTLATLGVFLAVINAAMLALVAWLLDGFRVTGFWQALLGSLVVSLTSWMASAFMPNHGKLEPLPIKKKR
jgi:putative membrane protein